VDPSTSCRRSCGCCAPHTSTGRSFSRRTSISPTWRDWSRFRDADFEVYELAVGPLNAGLAPPSQPDESLNPRVLFASGPFDPGALPDFASARRFFNFGTITVDAGGRLEAAVIDSSGVKLFELGFMRVAPASRDHGTALTWRA